MRGRADPGDAIDRYLRVSSLPPGGLRSSIDMATESKMGCIWSHRLPTLFGYMCICIGTTVHKPAFAPSKHILEFQVGCVSDSVVLTE